MASRWPECVQIREVGPRDGLQNEPGFVPTAVKLDWIGRLADAGLSYIEVTSFVSPKWIPPLADAEEVAAGLRRREGVTYAALVPNMRGLERALRSGIDEAAVFMSASETHNRRNINKSIGETLPVLREVTAAAKAAGKTVRGYLSTVFGCPYEGAVDTQQVVRLTEALLEMGVREVSLGDTIGIGHPRQVEAVLEELLGRVPPDRLALHFHDTNGLALANTVVALQMGIRTFDASCGGLGGCPYAPGAAGNVATGDLIRMLHAMGVRTGVDEAGLSEASAYILQALARTGGDPGAAAGDCLTGGDRDVCS
ncbi:Putative hydroxymethylglutaryl-CoA lyase [Thermobacillus xylanilyticus]|jgi:hydroxymethylglutaryl-CoA lyase|uniref:Isopropylmalate/homocitrate/citramalate synthase n=2 Tax=Thermobacillus TaxID=76632 RepID=L0E8K6_THECK|nr:MULTISPECIES: hydroxymethylglutaryl-CoA lyase [Thermobacillus]AGA56633.1 isopropylmalate/homocitrate/citramalate synthase [Thermobacillus composti KWC4]CAG5080145.1 Putative hydroxymethylglutaryl-CoA lyase [Thermobacillus xylanilyticus]